MKCICHNYITLTTQIIIMIAHSKKGEWSLCLFQTHKKKTHTHTHRQKTKSDKFQANTFIINEVSFHVSIDHFQYRTRITKGATILNIPPVIRNEDQTVELFNKTGKTEFSQNMSVARDDCQSLKKENTSRKNLSR